MTPAALASSEARVHLREQHAEAAVKAFTRLGAAPRPTFPLALFSVTVAVLAMHADLVAKYSLDAFWVGLVATAGLAIAVGRGLSSIRTPSARMLAALLLPTAGGAIVGMLVQALVLDAVAGTNGAMAVKDLGGLVDTTEPVTWLLAGALLGALPALLVSVFSMLAARALRTLVGNDAAEGFNVAFTGSAGLLAAVGLVMVDPWELPPLLGVCVLASVSMMVSFLVDGARLRFLRGVWAGVSSSADDHVRTGYEVVPADRFMHDPSLAPMVTKAGAVSVLVRVDRRVGSYRDAAAEPIALIADSELATTQPLRRRRSATVGVLAAMTLAAGLSTLAQPEMGSALGLGVLHPQTSAELH
ncbi:MAG: hypothetical protein JWP87_4027 [Labilithrix sp.]|nr:hypothetical protein [Labilithrix sp.]